MERFQELLCRHLRLHRALLMLWGRTCEAPLRDPEAPRLLPPENWRSWLERRRSLVDALVAQQSPGLAADASAAAEAAVGGETGDLLRRLHAKELEIMQAILGLERRLQQAAQAQLDYLASRLSAIRHAQMTRRGYAPPNRPTERVDRRG